MTWTGWCSTPLTQVHPVSVFSNCIHSGTDTQRSPLFNRTYQTWLVWRSFGSVSTLVLGSGIVWSILIAVTAQNTSTQTWKGRTQTCRCGNACEVRVRPLYCLSVMGTTETEPKNIQAVGFLSSSPPSFSAKLSLSPVASLAQPEPFIAQSDPCRGLEPPSLLQVNRQRHHKTGALYWPAGVRRWGGEEWRWARIKTGEHSKSG